ncbi:rhodanese-like domain-containing protein [Pseudonocardia yunnanensis]|uniref:Rhodanese-like domain-containing protein n=1 Tax=Pseudonocardia yunnanensis TaxID=58107 RepID=A0ABW4F6R4_9PSEU
MTVDSAAVAFFTTRLTFQTDVADVHTALDHTDPGFVLVDSRGTPAWRQSRIPGAVHLPTAQIPARAGLLLDPAVPLVTYCWGPGCNGATKAALAFAQLGYRVREMLGGVEYWIREGFPIETDMGTSTAGPDPLTAPCGC